MLSATFELNKRCELYLTPTKLSVVCKFFEKFDALAFEADKFCILELKLSNNVFVEAKKTPLSEVTAVTFVAELIWANLCLRTFNVTAKAGNK
jgi:hypothetical protein